MLRDDYERQRRVSVLPPGDKENEYMKLSAFFKSVIDQDRAPVVLCDLDHTILYMNPAAIRNYAKRGGEKNHRAKPTCLS